jgi:hypothetical protein
MRVVATAMCTRLANSADFKVLRVAMTRRSGDSDGTDGDNEEADGNDEDDDHDAESPALSSRSPRAAAPDQDATAAHLRPATVGDVGIEVADDEAGWDPAATPATLSALQQPTAVDANSVRRVIQAIPRQVAVALGLVPSSAASTARGGQLRGGGDASDDGTSDVNGLLSPALLEALEMLVPSATVHSPRPGSSAATAVMPAPTLSGLSGALNGLLAADVVRDSIAGIRAVVQRAFAAATEYAETFQRYRGIVVTDTRMLRRVTKELLASLPVAAIGGALTALTEQVGVCSGVPETRGINQLLRVDSERLKADVVPAPKACLDALSAMLPQVRCVSCMS